MSASLRPRTSAYLVTFVGLMPQNSIVRPLTCLTVESPTNGRYHPGESEVTASRPVRPASRPSGMPFSL